MAKDRAAVAGRSGGPAAERNIGWAVWRTSLPAAPNGYPASDLESKALKLAPEEHARLAELLLSSLEQVAEPESEARWLEEAERRLGELESGRVATEVFRKSRSALR